jgi:predicted Zn-dependent protease
MVEKLEYTLDDPKQDGVTVTLRWEQLTIPFPVSVKSNEVVMDSLRQQLRGLPRFFPDAWRMASAWALQHDDLAMASSWADSAINLAPTFGNLMLKSRVLAKQGNQTAADSLTTRALTIANEADMNIYGYGLLQAGKVDSAIVVFTNNTKKYPQSWNVWDSLGEAYGVKGDKKLAVANYKKALAMAPPGQTQRINGAIAALQ